MRFLTWTPLLLRAPLANLSYCDTVFSSIAGNFGRDGGVRIREQDQGLLPARRLGLPRQIDETPQLIVQLDRGRVVIFRVRYECSITGRTGGSEPTAGRIHPNHVVRDPIVERRGKTPVVLPPPGYFETPHLETLEPVKGGSLLVHFSETIATETGGRLRCNHRMSLECLAIRWHKS